MQSLYAAWKRRAERACLPQDNRFGTEHCYFSTESCFQQGQILIPKAFGVSHPSSFSHNTLPLSSFQSPSEISTNKKPQSSSADSHPEGTSNESPKVVSFTFQLYLQFMSATLHPLFGNVEWSSALTVSLLSQLCQPNL